MDDSILISTKEKLGLAQDYEVYDGQITSFINTALAVLSQLGVGPEGGLYIDGPTATWADLFTDGKTIAPAKEYVYLKVRLLFDPPSSSFVLESYNKQLAEFEWRINVMVDKASE